MNDGADIVDVVRRASGEEERATAAYAPKANRAVRLRRRACTPARPRTPAVPEWAATGRSTRPWRNVLRSRRDACGSLRAIGTAARLSDDGNIVEVRGSFGRGRCGKLTAVSRSPATRHAVAWAIETTIAPTTPARTTTEIIERSNARVGVARDSVNV